MIDLLDDEFNEVQQSALAQLYHFLQNYSKEEIKNSTLVEVLVRLYTTRREQSQLELVKHLIEQSVKIMHVCDASKQLIAPTLQLYRHQVSLQVQIDFSENDEWAQDEEVPNTTVDKTFLQMLMEDEIDFDRESALDKQEIEADRNCAVRQLITD